MNRFLAIPSCSRPMIWQRLGLLGALLLPGAVVLAEGGNLADGRTPKKTQSASDAAAQPQPGKKADQKKKPGKTTFEDSGETPAERAARLKRECKGRPNAGACTGYAQ